MQNVISERLHHERRNNVTVKVFLSLLVLIILFTSVRYPYRYGTTVPGASTTRSLYRIVSIIIIMHKKYRLTFALFIF